MAKKLRQCAFCEQPTIGRCSWKHHRFVVVAATDLRAGEIIRRWNEQEPRTTKVARIIDIAKLSEGAYVTFTISKADGTPDKTRREWLTAAKAIRLAPCGRQVCELHARELGDDVHQCPEHQEEWAKIA